MKLSKYEVKFVKAMIRVFSVIVAITIIIRLSGASAYVTLTSLGFMLVISYFLKRYYWNRFEMEEFAEEMKDVTT